LFVNGILIIRGIGHGSGISNTSSRDGLVGGSEMWTFVIIVGGTEHSGEEVAPNVILFALLTGARGRDRVDRGSTATPPRRRPDILLCDSRYVHDLAAEQ